jgi:transcriptional regulator with XRE-family HTH domain
MRAPLAKNLRRLRQAAGLTQQQVAERTGCKQSAYSKWECGKAIPKVDVLLHLALALDVSADRLLSGLNPTYDFEALARARLEQSPVLRASASEGAPIDGLAPRVLDTDMQAALRAFDGLSLGELFRRLFYGDETTRRDRPDQPDRRRLADAHDQQGPSSRRAQHG